MYTFCSDKCALSWLYICVPSGQKPPTSIQQQSAPQGTAHDDDYVNNKMAKHQYVAVTNIPSHFHAADLRSHFSSLIESNSFICFHFRHRPEKGNDTADDKKRADLKRCCVVKVEETGLARLLGYHGQHWTDVNGDFVVGECCVSQIKTNTPDTVDEKQLLQMPEFRPPELIPRGNVGTPTLVFLDLIQHCLLPHNLISKLQLRFPKTAAKRIYGNVNFHYDYSGSRKDTEYADKSISQLKYSGGSRLSAKPLFKKKPPSELNESKMHVFMIHKNLHYTNKQETDSENSVVDTDTENSLSHFEHESDSSNTDQETQKPEKSSRDISLEHSVISSTVTSAGCFHPDIGVTTLTPGFSEDQLSKSVVTCDKFIVPTALPILTAECTEDQSNNSVISGDKFLVPTALPVKSQKLTNKERRRLQKDLRHHIKKLKAENIEEKLIAVEKRYHNDEDAEEWDRHEASEDDPSNQERNTERLYEEEIEQPWEKGGPGVVFYTDAMLWHQKEGDFDEQTTDDLDVDFSAYEEPGAGDKDIKDFLKIRQERRFRDGYDDTDRFSLGIGKRLKESASRSSSIRSRIGEFECHSKGIGRKVMEKQGWTEGQGLGRSMPGIVKALKGEGQAPHNKRGLGYTKVKPVMYGCGKKQNSRSQPHLITSIYDDPKITDPKEPLLQRCEPSTLKHRQSHVKQFS